MAVDTENKRRSAASLPTIVIAPEPDSAISAADRIHIVGYYSGIIAAAELTDNFLMSVSEIDEIYFVKDIDR